MTQERTRRAEISGAGFAGLTAGIALARLGWQVRVHEKHPDFRSEGAGIVLWQNSISILNEFGVTDRFLAGSMQSPYYETRMQNQIMSQEDLSEVGWRSLTRPFLYELLLDTAQENGVEVLIGSEVTHAAEDGTVTFGDGSSVKADLIVGADGVGSTVRDTLGIRYDRQTSRDGIIRFLVPRRKADLQALEPDTDWDNYIDFWNLEPRVLRALYVPCNENELYLALMAPAEDLEGSRVPINVDLWKSIHPQLAPVLEEAGKLNGRYFRYQTNHLERWTQGHAVLIGDSAHALCPALAQGAGCSMMNAYTMAQAVSAVSVEEIPLALQQWEQLERPYTDRCQTRSQAYADTRNMAHGHQWQASILETATYHPTDPERHQKAFNA